MKLKDLMKRINDKESIHGKTLFEPMLSKYLLEDQRGLNTIERERQFSYFRECKERNSESFKILQLSYGYTLNKISLAKNLNSVPYYKRGTKGFILDDNALYLLPSGKRELVATMMRCKDVKLCLISEVMVTLPSDHYRVLKR